MGRMIAWLKIHEIKVFKWVNSRPANPVARYILERITHLGGATFTILTSLIFIIFAREPWDDIALQSLLALALSHIPVALFKKKYPRLRPYLVLPETMTGKAPLVDHSFPSGHTTAIFSVILPFVLAYPPFGFLLLPLAITVGYSRMFLGLHYPSDCLVGSLIGTGSAVLIHLLWY